MAAQRPALVVTGARQVGKTSLLRRVFPHHHFVSLDLPSDAAMAESAPDSFLALHPAPLLVDEVQYAPGLFRHLKRVIDAQRAMRGQLVLTGSQKFALLREVGDSLAGRIGLLELDPLSLREIRRVEAIVTLDALIVRGGYPELWEARDIDATDFFHAYVANYLERDLRSMLRVSSLRDFERFIRVCALRSGQLLNKAELARDVGISASTAEQWLQTLVAASLIALVEPWYANGTKRIAKTPKLYFCDTGLLCFLLNVRDEAALAGSPLRGAIFETAAYCELRKRLALTREVESLYFYRDRDFEVDFLLHRAGRFVLMESKWTEIPEQGDVSALLKLTRMVGEDLVLKRLLLCRTRSQHPLGGATAVSIDQLPDL